MTGQTLPCAVKVSGGTVNGTTQPSSYHSIAVTSFTVNITPLTNLIVANLAGVDPATWFTGLNNQAIQSLTQSSLDSAISRVKTALGMSDALGTNNPVSTPFQAVSGNTLDDILEALADAAADYTDLLTRAQQTQSFTAPVGFDFASAYEALSSGTGGGGGGSTANCGTGETAMTYATTAASGPYANGDQVCFTATSTSLAFSGKTLTNPTANTTVTAPYSAYSFVDGANTYEVIFNAGNLYEINVSFNGTFNGQFAPGTGTGTSGNANLTLQVNVNGIASTTINVGNVPKPSAQTDFCNEIQNDSNLASIGTAAGGTLTINSCSYSGNVGTISATVSLTSPVVMSIPYTVIYTYN